MNSTLSLLGKSGIYSPIEQAEREDRVVRKWADDVIPSDTSPTILTNTAYNLEANTILYITELFTNISSVSDDCEFLILKCDGANGSGANEQVTPGIHLFSAAAGIGFAGKQLGFNPAIVIRYSNGWRSAVVQITTGDAATSVTVGWAGYWEKVAI
ncbi:MAG: hypothetical protein ACYSW7_12285 [Planctomycetota bacterium]|jgi:hypothetical protein